MKVATKLIHVLTLKDRLLTAWLCLTGKVDCVAIIVTDKEMYK